MASVAERLDAVVFDYYGTLTVSARASVRNALALEVANALGVAGDVYVTALAESFTERATGSRGDLAETMRWLASRCGGAPDAEQLEAACALRRVIEGEFAAALRAEAVDTLRVLRQAGLRVGVVSDCTHELAERWPTLAVAEVVDTAVFSVVEGRRKPDPALYATVCGRLGVDPAAVLYVGDGGSNELTGAIAAGMRAVRLVADDAAEAIVYDPEPDWRGPVIHALSELVRGPGAVVTTT
jgi:putative hydrolase of the HAD superfamily